MNRPGKIKLIATLAIAAGTAAAIWSVTSIARDDHRNQAGKSAPQLAAYKQECGACHATFPPGMLPVASWRRIMDNLKRHYGTDASLEPAAQSEISTWISANAGSYKRVREEPFQDRITLSEWFIRKHREVPAAKWKLPAIKSAANCAACHPQADLGDFNERSIRIPR